MVGTIDSSVIGAASGGGPWGPRGVLECANFDTNSQGRIFSSFTKIVDFAFFSASGIPRFFFVS